MKIEEGNNIPCRICLGIGSTSKKITKEGYHEPCLKRLFGTSNVRTTLDRNESEFLEEAVQKFSEKASISGVQKKVSVKLVSGKLELTDVGGQFILKPRPDGYPECPANEHLSMLIGKLLGIDSAECGLVSFRSGELAYITKRFDREGETKIHQEDMAQIMGRERDEAGNYKYDSSYEEVALKILEASGGKHSVVIRFIERVLFRFVIGDQDYHLKNISMRGLKGQEFSELTPDYDAVQTVMYLADNLGYFGLKGGLFAANRLGKKYQIIGFPSADDFLELVNASGVSTKPIENFITGINSKRQEIFDLITRSYLTETKKEEYAATVKERLSCLFQ